MAALLSAKAKRIAIAVTVAGVAILILVFSKLGDNLVYFYTPEEAVAQANSISGRVIRVGGMVKAGSLTRRKDGVSFVVTDMRNVDIAANFTGTPPDMFGESQGVVVEGLISANGDSIEATKLLVKHSEEYRAPTSSAPPDHTLLEKSLFKE